MKCVLFAQLILSVSLCGHTAAVTNQTVDASRTYQLETIIVLAERILPLADTMTHEELLDAPLNISAAHAAQSVPGAGGSCRSIDAPEISIRGLGWERVPVQLDYLPLYGSCPARMDPPATYMTPDSIAVLKIIKGLPSVTYGAGGTGGRVMARSVSDLTYPAINGYAAHASANWNEGRDGWTSAAGASAGNGRAEAEAAVQRIDLNDYESGDGREVPAENRSHSASVRVRLTPDSDNGYFANWNLHKVDHLDYPALPMDATDVTSHTFTFGGRHKNLSGRMQAIEWQAGYADSTHLMDNARKPNRPRVNAEADTESETFGGRIATDWIFSGDNRWTFGADSHRLNRDGTRTREVKIGPPPPGVYRDPIWPDATQDQIGLFAERSATLDNDSRLRLGLRTDAVMSSIDRGNEATPFDPTVRDGYAKYYGNNARDTDRDEWLVSGNVLYEYPQNEILEWFIGAGMVQRAASITELFYAYAPAPGGFQVGNPTLEPETKLELDCGAYLYGDRLELDIHAFAAHVFDYILETRIDTLANGATVRGFENTDALLAGGEMYGRWILSGHWSIPFDAAYVRGRNLSDDRDLPLIPPLNGSIGLRWDSGLAYRPWAEAVFRAATSQHRTDPDFGESDTAAWQIVNLRGGAALPNGIAVEAGVENLFDQDYADHLSRETPFAVGDLQAGDRIPMPGRFFYAGIRWTL